MKQSRLLGNKNALGYKHTPEEIEKIRQASIKLWKNEKHRKLISQKMKGNQFAKGYKDSLERSEKRQEASRKLWQQKWYRDKMMEVAKKPNAGKFKKGLIPWNKNKKLSEGKIGKRFYHGIKNRIKKEKCVWCGSKENLEYDHKLARKKGGTNDDNNCQVLCKKCNLLKRYLIDYPELYHNFNAKRANSVETCDGNAELNQRKL